MSCHKLRFYIGITVLIYNISLRDHPTISCSISLLTTLNLSLGDVSQAVIVGKTPFIFCKISNKKQIL